MIRVQATRRTGFLSLGGDFSCDATAGDFLDLIDVGLSPRRSQMDPAEERRDTKRQKEFINMQGYVADSEYGIPTRCPCGGRIIDEVWGKDDYDTLSGKRFFSCKKYEADGFHYRQPWVIGAQEHIERLTKRVEEVELVIKWVPEVNNQIERLEVNPQSRKEPAEEVPAEEDVRPPGVKASNAAKRKKHANEAAFDQIESILAAKNTISKQKILDRLLAKTEATLSPQEVSLKNKLISEML
uniref:Zinc finger GRF-type domain-containing protein n=1 Tax=Brassica oleracea var. oleracea TaxID=109376 RepID=A0A0D3CYM5_BRAOL